MNIPASRNDLQCSPRGTMCDSVEFVLTYCRQKNIGWRSLWVSSESLNSSPYQWLHRRQNNLYANQTWLLKPCRTTIRDDLSLRSSIVMCRKTGSIWRHGTSFSPFPPFSLSNNKLPILSEAITLPIMILTQTNLLFWTHAYDRLQLTSLANRLHIIRMALQWPICNGSKNLKFGSLTVLAAFFVFQSPKISKPLSHFKSAKDSSSSFVMQSCFCRSCWRSYMRHEV